MKAIKISITKVAIAVFALVLITTGYFRMVRVSADDGGIFEIRERFFVTQMHDIFFNSSRYLGRTIRYEGIFSTIDSGGRTYGYVIRHTHGCCGPDGMIGFAALLNDIEPLPGNTWVEITGVLIEYMEEAGLTPILMLDAVSIIEMAERGMEFVEN